MTYHRYVDLLFSSLRAIERYQVDANSAREPNNVLYGHFKILVTFESSIYLMSHEVEHYPLFCTSSQLEKFGKNIIGVLYGQMVLEHEHAINFLKLINRC